MLELEEIRRGVAHDKGLVHFDSAVKAKAHVGEKRHVALLTKLVEPVKVALLTEGDAKVPWVHGELVHRHPHGRALH